MTAPRAGLNTAGATPEQLEAMVYLQIRYCPIQALQELGEYLSQDERRIAAWCIHHSGLEAEAEAAGIDLGEPERLREGFAWDERDGRRTESPEARMRYELGLDA